MEGFKNSMKKKGNFEKDDDLKEQRGGVGRRKVPFHLPSIPRPQEQYNILVNNLNQPFEHVWLERSEDGSRFVHPMEKLSVLDFVGGHVRENVQANWHPIEHTPFKLVEGVKELKELATKLWEVTEFAVDLEHNQYRSFQGLTCLMQISTRTEDFVIDILKLRVQIGPYLREVFKDPSKRKVMHGADRDILWLQRDFGIYVCNLFDTGQASRMLQLERNSLEYLLHHFCGIRANKEYQNADWRLRPLPDEMLKYAREDTHYLLLIYDLMKSRLLSAPDGNKEALLIEVCKQSNEICMQLYEKELLTDSSFLYIYGLQEAHFNSQQLSIASGLYEWRDNVARTEDESTGYILPNKALLEIAREMPISSSKLRHLVKLKSPYAVRNLQSLMRIIRSSIQNASAFENLAEVLKNGQQEATYEQYNQALGYSSVSQPYVENPMACTISQKAVFHGSDKSRAFQGSAHVNTSFSAENRYTKTADRVQFNCQIVKVGKCQEQERLQRLPLPEVGCFFKLSNAAEKKYMEEMDNGSIKCSETAKPAIFPTFKILKKATSGFGTGLRNPSSNKMSDHDGGYANEKDMADIQIQQLKSSTLPFRSFSGVERLWEPSPPGQCLNSSYQGMLQRPKANEEQESALLRSEIEKPSRSAGIPVTDGGMKFREQLPCHPENGSLQTFQARFDASRDPQSVTYMSSSLEECCPLKPFHQVAAKQQIEPWEPQAGGTVGADELRTSRGSGEICDSKGSFFDPAHGQERTGKFQPTWWQKAFPPPVNRSTDHR